MSPEDSGEYVCQVVSGSGPLEASVLINIEASGSSSVPVPGEDSCVGARRLEKGGSRGEPAGRGREPGQVGCLGPENQIWEGAWPMWAGGPAPLSTL